MNKKSTFLSLCVLITILSLLSVPVMASIPMEGEDYKSGVYDCWAWAWLYAEYNPFTKTYHNIQHDWDWDGWGDYDYFALFLYSNDAEYPGTRTKVYYSTDGRHFYPDPKADAIVQFYPV